MHFMDLGGRWWVGISLTHWAEQGFAESVQSSINNARVYIYILIYFRYCTQVLLLYLALKISCFHININSFHLGLHFRRTFERFYVLNDTQGFCSTTPLGVDQSCFNIISVLQQNRIIYKCTGKGSCRTVYDLTLQPQSNHPGIIANSRAY